MRVLLLAVCSAAALMLAACHTDIVFHAYRSVGSQGWDVDDTLEFRLPSPLTDGQYGLQLGVKHSGVYPYQDIWIVLLRPGCEAEQPDTFHLHLADGDGYWLGSGTQSSSFQFESESCTVTLHEADALLQVIHLMDTARLKGITDIGVKLTALK